MVDIWYYVYAFPEWLAAAIPAIWSHHQTCDASSQESGYFPEIYAQGILICMAACKLVCYCKLQALLQMQDVPSAVNALQFYSNVQPSIR